MRSIYHSIWTRLLLVHPSLEQSIVSDFASMYLKVIMHSSVIFCAASTPVIVQNRCTSYYLTEACNVLYASKDQR